MPEGPPRQVTRSLQDEECAPAGLGFLGPFSFNKANCSRDARVSAGGNESPEFLERERWTEGAREREEWSLSP